MSAFYSFPIVESKNNVLTKDLIAPFAEKYEDRMHFCSLLDYLDYFTGAVKTCSVDHESHYLEIGYDPIKHDEKVRNELTDVIIDVWRHNHLLSKSSTTVQYMHMIRMVIFRCVFKCTDLSIDVTSKTSVSIDSSLASLAHVLSRLLIGMQKNCLERQDITEQINKETIDELTKLILGANQQAIKYQFLKNSIINLFVCAKIELV